jgi:hypothetical protein
LYNGKYLPRKGETSGQVELNYLIITSALIRYAEVLLMAAEANNRATAPNDTKAQGYLNQVRQRAFGDATHNITATGGTLKQAIWDERRLELAMEGDRFFDLVRTGQAATKITGLKPVKMKYSRYRNTESRYFRLNTKSRLLIINHLKLTIMNAIKYFLGIAFLLAVLAGCKKEEFTDTSFAKNAHCTRQSSVLFDITQDNTGLVTIIPNGESAVSYDVYLWRWRHHLC